MISYRNSIKSDSSQIAKTHLQAFPDFFLSTLGLSFLNTYYKSCVRSKDAISISAIEDETNNLVGFSVGCFKSAGFNKKLIYSNIINFSYQFISLIFLNPKALIRLFKNFRKVNHVDDDGKYAELLSIGVLPEKNGLGIGKKLLIKFENKVREKGVNTITLTTDLESNDNVLNFYKKCGYKVYYDFITFPNRKMLKLIKELEK